MTHRGNPTSRICASCNHTEVIEPLALLAIGIRDVRDRCHVGLKVCQKALESFLIRFATDGCCPNETQNADIELL